MGYSLDQEGLAASIMLPPVVLRDVFNGSYETEALGISRFDYKDGLDRIAFSGRRDHKAFRDFLEKHRVLFEEWYPAVETLTDGEIDYILDMVREERTLIALEDISRADARVPNRH